MLSPDLYKLKCQQRILYTPYTLNSQHDFWQTYISNELYMSGCIVYYD